MFWINCAREAFISKFGNAEGTRICSVVMPGIMGDFRKCLERAMPGVSVTEEYRLEHTKSTVTVRGYKQLRDGKAELILTELSVDDVKAELGSGTIL